MKALHFAAKLFSLNRMTIPKQNIIAIAKNLGIPEGSLFEAVFILKITGIIIPGGQRFDFTKDL